MYNYRSATQFGGMTVYTRPDGTVQINASPTFLTTPVATLIDADVLAIVIRAYTEICAIHAYEVRGGDYPHPEYYTFS